ncbi:hypothetical protein BDP27DRAFT_1172558, partial [Rhodocollybia butyracea]
TNIPTLKVCNNEGATISTAETNEQKAALLASTFFPDAPREYELDRNPCRDPLPPPPPITEERIISVFQRLKPYKAPGPDQIPNIVLKVCAGHLSPFLVRIYNCFPKLKAYPNLWHLSDTAVLRKPGKSTYSIPKSYRPIALLQNMSKGYTTILAEDISHLAEKHQLLPETQFGG